MATRVTIDTQALGIPWEPNTTYKITLTKGLVNATSGTRAPSADYPDLVTFITTGTTPNVDTTTPADGGVTERLTAPGRTIDVNFDRPMFVGIGSAALYKTGTPDVLVHTFDLETDIEIIDDNIAFDVTGMLEPDTEYTLVVNSGTFKDVDNFAWTGYASGDWTFSSLPTPYVEQLTPSSGSTLEPMSSSVLPRTFSVDFDRWMQNGDGTFYLYKSDGTPVHTFGVGDTAIVEDVVSLDAAGYLEPSTNYYILSDADAVKDYEPFDFDGFLANTDYVFTSAPPPQITSTYPSNGATNFLDYGTFYVEFDRLNLTLDTGTISVYEVGNATPITTYDIPADATINNYQMQFYVEGVLEPSKDYYITATSDSLHDLENFSWAGVTSDTVYAFSTGSDYKRNLTRTFFNMNYIEDTQLTLSSGPRVLARYSTDTFSLVLTPDANSIVNMVSDVTGGTFVWNGTTATITGTKAEINARLDAMVLTPQTDYEDDINIDFTITADSDSFQTSVTMQLINVATNIEVTNITEDRIYIGGTGFNYVFDSLTPVIEDGNVFGAVYEIELSAASGQFDNVDDSNPANPLIITGTKTEINAAIPKIVYKATGVTGDQTITYQQRRDDFLQVDQDILLVDTSPVENNGILRVFSQNTTSALFETNPIQITETVSDSEYTALVSDANNNLRFGATEIGAQYSVSLTGTRAEVNAWLAALLVVPDTDVGGQQTFQVQITRTKGLDGGDIIFDEIQDAFGLVNVTQDRTYRINQADLVFATDTPTVSGTGTYFVSLTLDGTDGYIGVSYQDPVWNAVDRRYEITGTASEINDFFADVRFWPGRDESNDFTMTLRIDVNGATAVIKNVVLEALPAPLLFGSQAIPLTFYEDAADQEILDWPTIHPYYGDNFTVKIYPWDGVGDDQFTTMSGLGWTWHVEPNELVWLERTFQAPVLPEHISTYLADIRFTPYPDSTVVNFLIASGYDTEQSVYTGYNYLGSYTAPATPSDPSVYDYYTEYPSGDLYWWDGVAWSPLWSEYGRITGQLFANTPEFGDAPTWTGGNINYIYEDDFFSFDRYAILDGAPNKTYTMTIEPSPVYGTYGKFYLDSVEQGTSITFTGTISECNQALASRIYWKNDPGLANDADVVFIYNQTQDTDGIDQVVDLTINTEIIFKKDSIGTFELRSDYISDGVNVAPVAPNLFPSGAYDMTMVSDSFGAQKIVACGASNNVSGTAYASVAWIDFGNWYNQTWTQPVVGASYGYDGTAYSINTHTYSGYSDAGLFIAGNDLTGGGNNIGILYSNNGGSNWYIPTSGATNLDGRTASTVHYYNSSTGEVNGSLYHYVGGTNGTVRYWYPSTTSLGDGYGTRANGTTGTLLPSYIDGSVIGIVGGYDTANSYYRVILFTDSTSSRKVWRATSSVTSFSSVTYSSGTTWPSTVPTNGRFEKVGWNGFGHIVGIYSVDAGGGARIYYILYSSNSGINWSKANFNTSGVNQQKTDVRWIGDKWVMTLDSRALYSTDGLTWQSYMIDFEATALVHYDVPGGVTKVFGHGSLACEIEGTYYRWYIPAYGSQEAKNITIYSSPWTNRSAALASFASQLNAAKGTAPWTVTNTGTAIEVDLNNDSFDTYLQSVTNVTPMSTTQSAYYSKIGPWPATNDPGNIFTNSERNSD